MENENQKQDTQKVYVSYPLEGEELERFLRFKKAHNIKNNAEAGRKALLDQMDAFEAERRVA